MKPVFFFLLLALFAIGTFAQLPVFPEGVYLTREQMQNLTPAYKLKLRVIRRTSGDVFMVGGNDYKLVSDNDSLSGKFIKTKIFAYVTGDSVFLNNLPFTEQPWYSRCLTRGNFLAFKTAVPDKNSATYGVLFGAIGGAIAAGTAAQDRTLFVLSLRTGNAKHLTKAYLMERLTNYPDLFDRFNSEKEKDSEETILKYLNLLNQVVSMKTLPATVK